MIKINYESDFKLTEKAEDGFANVPFRFAYSVNSGAYTASYDGEKYTNCKRNEDGSVTVIFNNHGLGVGRLKVRREFFIPDTDFPDSVYNVVSVDNTEVMLVEGKTDGYNVEETFQPPYISTGIGSGLDFAEITEAPKETPVENSLCVDTTHNVVYFGVANKGWWKTSVKNLTDEELKVEEDTLLIDASSDVENTTLLLATGKVENNILVL